MKSDDLQQAIYNQLNHSSVTSLLSQAYSPSEGESYVKEDGGFYLLEDGDKMLLESIVFVSIFTDVPQANDSELETYFPFVTIGGDTINPFDSKDDAGGSAIVQIDVWDRSTSMLDIKAIADAIDGRLRRQPLSISGVTHITTELDSCNFTRDPDGKTKRALILYRVLWIA